MAELLLDLRERYFDGFGLRYVERICKSFDIWVSGLDCLFSGSQLLRIRSQQYNALHISLDESWDHGLCNT
jgi:hypothetical protein